MTKAEEIALSNDLKKLKTLFNPQYATIYVLPKKTGCSYCLKVVMKVPTYVSRRAQSGPIFKNGIEFFIDIFNDYPKTKPRVYYGDEEWLYHVNVFNSEGHSQCTDEWNKDSDLYQIIEKTARAIVFDDNQKFNSMASSIPEKWQKDMKAKGKLPTMNAALLFARNVKRTPKAV